MIKNDTKRRRIYICHTSRSDKAKVSAKNYGCPNNDKNAMNKMFFTEKLKEIIHFLHPR